MTQISPKEAAAGKSPNSKDKLKLFQLPGRKEEVTSDEGRNTNEHNVAAEYQCRGGLKLLS